MDTVKKPWEKELTCENELLRIAFSLLICLMAYPLFMAYLKQKFDSFVNVLFRLVCLYSGILNPYGLSKARIWLICECLV